MNTPKKGGRYKRLPDGTVVPAGTEPTPVPAPISPTPAADPVLATATAADDTQEDH